MAAVARLRWVQALVVVAVWVLLATLLKGRQTLELSTASDSTFTGWLRELASAIRGNRTESPVFVYFFNPIRGAIEAFIEAIMRIVSMPGPGDVIPVLGWFGAFALIGYVVYVASSSLRATGFSLLMLLLCGMLGMWVVTMDTLAMTIGAVLLSLAIALPLGVWAGLDARVMAVLRPGLDLAQVLPTLVYLAPLALVFLIGIASATIATMIYSIPICIRITAHAIASLKAGPIEAAVAAGSTRWQVLTKVQLPMAKSTIILAINQTTLAALSFVVIAALIGAPGLGKPVVEALVIRDVGDGVVAGLAVVFLAIMLDRATAAAVGRDQHLRGTGGSQRARRIGLVVGALLALVAIYLSRTVLWFAVFPESLEFGDRVAEVADRAQEWITANFDILTVTGSEWFTVWALNPLEGVLADGPWWATLAAISLLAFILAGRSVGILVTVLLVLIVGTGLWNDAMLTLAMTLIATGFVVALGIVLGVWTGRSDRVERAFRPFLDAGQTMPAFVYLVPVLALFGPTRFAAIVLGVVYAAPVVIRVVADGIRRVPAQSVEAAVSAGSTGLQVISKVQLPMARRAILLGANQGLIFVLAVVVIGGFVGAGGLGYLVIVGQSKPELAGKSLAAGIAIVLLGVILDRIAQGRPERSSPARR